MLESAFNLGARDQHLIASTDCTGPGGRLETRGRRQNQVDMIFIENAATAHLQAARPRSHKTIQPWQARRISSAKAKPSIAGGGSTIACRRICRLWTNRFRPGCLADRLDLRKGTPLRYHAEPPMTRFLAWQLASSHWFDISAARRDFDYEPEGMHCLGEWLQRAGRMSWGDGAVIAT